MGVYMHRSVRTTGNSYNVRLNSFTQNTCPQVFVARSFLNGTFLIQCNLDYSCLSGTQLVKLGLKA